MAFVGMQHVVVATIASVTEGSEPTYDAGKVLGKAISANLSITRNDNPLHADDVEAENDRSITAMSIEIGVDDILEDVKVYLGLLKEVAGTGSAPTVYYEPASTPKNTGLGYMRVRRKNGVTRYQAIWVFDTIFGPESEASQTKGESIEWQTPTVNGACLAHLVTDVDPSEPMFRKIAVFDTAAAAIAWLDQQAGI